ncbi:1-deoxy-D-xylulose-5-phosphate synthase [Neomoorella thermoacetica]|uniref:1-deoxy-D-xylulose-5-phosphate synthase n=1 Tax=Neomoorella thermoacetica TaxID=1525 RepID=UPI0008FB1C95|nr:1-deoxy-D-xylulose-5-phosphate synthase [Moorella thermoacetica]APC08721.1 1-deoxy-D-xylulose-5-phosphate synthase [Moorella thermoacetica]
MSLLEKINEPAALKKFTLAELDILAREIRQELVQTVARTGGHLAPNLGVVELTLALHSVFDLPRDKIIWDVGHQCYVHKILTGRRQEMTSLRQFGGLSGFPKRAESPYDAFDTGHSSTSISAALGMALARDLKGEDYQVVAVIGDGALTGGMAFEAMNHAGHLQANLIVVLNDNEMSIAPPVGGLAAYLSRLRTDPMYSRGKEELENLLNRLPHLGPRVLKVIDRLKDSFKYLVVPGMFFEEIGFTYLGPIEGHNIARLKEVLQHARNTRGPVLVHVITTKGKGYQPAEEHPDRFHGIGPFDPATGEPLAGGGPPTYTSVFGAELVRQGEKNNRLVAITAAMPDGTGLTPFARRFPKRFFDVGIAEQHALTLAAGLAAAGMHPVVAIYSTFLQRAIDQVIHDIALMELPVVLAIDRAGLVGEDGETHQGLFDVSLLRCVPGLVFMAPKDEQELRHMLVTALQYQGPAALRYPRGAGMGVPLTGTAQPLPIGKGEVLRRGRDVTILALGPLVYAALEAAGDLAARGIEATVINPRFIKPLDEDLILTWADRTGHLVTVEEHVLSGGFGSAVLELLARNGRKGIRVRCLGVKDEFVHQGKPAILREHLGLTPAGIRAAVQALLAETPILHRRRNQTKGISGG